VEKIVDKVFAEGLVANGNKFWMLTYKANVIIEYDQHFNQIRTLPWPHGEGWGFTTDGCRLYANTGKDFILHLDMKTGKLIKMVQVTKNGKPLTMLNEMEYVTPYLWINIWLTNTLVAIDPRNGVVKRELSLARVTTIEEARREMAGQRYSQRDCVPRFSYWPAVSASNG